MTRLGLPHTWHAHFHAATKGAAECLYLQLLLVARCHALRQGVLGCVLERGGEHLHVLVLAVHPPRVLQLPRCKGVDIKHMHKPFFIYYQHYSNMTEK